MSNIKKAIVLVLALLLLSSCVFWDFTFDRQVNFLDLGEYYIGILDMKAYKDYLYLLNVNYGLISVDISNPSKPEISDRIIPSVSEVYINHYTSDYLCFNGDYLYTRKNIINITLPNALSNVGTLPFSCDSIFTSEDYLYTTEGTSFNIYNLLDPVAPVFEGSLSIGITGNSIYVRDNYAYVAADNKILIIDITAKANPMLTSTFIIPTAQFKVSGSYIITISQSQSFSIIDITDKSKPFIRFSERKKQLLSNFEISGNYVFFDLFDTIEIYDISNPNKPKLVEEPDKRGTDQFTIYSDYLYCAGTYSNSDDPKVSNYLVTMLISSYTD